MREKKTLPRTEAALQDMEQVETPAFIYVERTLQERARHISQVARVAGANLLYSLKALSFADAVSPIAETVNGLAASSLFEAKLARELVGDTGTVHTFSPAYNHGEIGQLAALSDYIVFNSLGQWRSLKQLVSGSTRYGLRINPKRSVVKDERYDPCRRHSKLGVPIDDLRTLLEADRTELSGITGIHIHTNCRSGDFEALWRTVRHCEAQIAPLFDELAWINLGGGYLFDPGQSAEAFDAAVSLLRDRYGLQVFIEPGAAFVRDAGFLVASVLDMIISDGKEVAILDTSVNHMPEVFEYQVEPEVIGHTAHGKHRCILAGRSCLAGDIFGEYAFDRSLRIGSRIVFAGAGAYTAVKAHMFNGINLPSIYVQTTDGRLVLKRKYAYDDFRSRLGKRGD